MTSLRFVWLCIPCILLGTAVLVLTTTDEDKTGASYYGEQSLHYISTSGDSSMVQLGKN